MTQSSGKEKKGKKQTWTGAEKFRVLTEAAGKSESDLGALLRREGLHETQLSEWRQAAEAALGETARGRAPKPSSEDLRTAARIKELEREVSRKDRALAETAALLVLKKKVQEIWGTSGESSEDGDDTTDRRRGR